MDWREHPGLVLAGLGLIAAVLVVVSARGCGCGHSVGHAPVVSKKSTDGGKKKKKEWMDDCQEPPNWGKEDETPKPPPPVATVRAAPALRP